MKISTASGRLAIAGAAMTAAVFAASISAAATVTHNCGKSIRTVVKTETTPFTTGSTVFVNIPGAVLQYTVPAGQQECFKVTFSALGRCATTVNPDQCFIRVGEVGGAVFDPPFNGIDFINESDLPEARSFEWIKILGPGPHTIRAQAAVLNFGTFFNVDGWTMSVEISD